jgi:hypothetical protein
MEECNKCRKIGEIVKPGSRCRECVNLYKRSWARAKKVHQCSLCKIEFIQNSPATECSIKCRILNRINKVNGCWEWVGKITNSGYGQTTHQRKYKTTHRLSYEIFKGPIGKGKIVCHSCDNKKCINPDHLWLGTQKENIQDALKKNRCGMQKLKIEDIDIIRRMVDEGINPIEIGDIFGVKKQAIYCIKYRKTWNLTQDKK